MENFMEKVFPIYQKFSPSDADLIKWALVNVAQERALQPAEIELLLRMHTISCQISCEDE